MPDWRFSAGRDGARSRKVVFSFGAGAVLALACAKYEDLSPPAIDGGAQGGTAGSSAGSSGGGVGGGSAGTSPGAGTGGTSSPTAGTGGVAAAAGDGAGGDSSGGGAGGDSSGGGAGGDSSGGGAGGDSACTGSATECILRAGLVHRYSFDGSGPAVTDSVGDADGTANGSPTFGSGQLTMSGTNQYVALPDNLLSGLTSATFEAWVTWSDNSGGDWQRIFDFGSSDVSQGQGIGETYLFVTPQAAGTLRTAYTTSGPVGEDLVNGAAALPTASEHVIAVVIDEAAHQLKLYLDGVSAGSAATLPTNALSALTYENNCLGRSQFASDPEFEGIFNEFRVYDIALTSAQLQASFSAGPNPAFLSQ